MFLITIVLGGLVIWLIHIWYNKKFEYWIQHKIPYIPSSPFHILYEFLFTRKILLDIMTEDYAKLEGHKFGGHMMMFSPSLMIRDADLLHRICIKDFSHFSDRAPKVFLTSIISQNLFSLTGNRWRTLRHKMTSTFTSGKLKLMFPHIKENCDEVVSFLNKKGDEAINSKEVMFKFVINVIGNVSFGLNVDALNEEKEHTNEFLNISKSVFQPSFSTIFKFMFTAAFPKIAQLLKMSVFDDKIEYFLQNLVKNIIAHREKTGEVRNDFLQLMLDQQKKEELEFSSTESTTFKATGFTEERAEPEDDELLSQLKYLKNKNDKSIKVFTNDSIVAQSFVFIAGGSETIATALSFIFYDFTQNPECQEQVQQEVDDVLCKHGFTYEALKKMTYLEQCINESMRLHPSSPFQARVCTKDYTIPDTDIQIKKGISVSLPTANIMNDAKYFPDPSKYNPENFKNIDALHPGTELAFGIGPRMCIAKRLALLEIKMLVASVMQTFTVKLSPKTKMPIKLEKASLFAQVVGGIWLQFERRNKLK